MRRFGLASVLTAVAVVAAVVFGLPAGATLAALRGPLRAPRPAPEPVALTAAARAVIRLDQVGFMPGDRKLAYALTRRRVAPLRFRIVDGRGATFLLGSGRGCPSWTPRWQGCQTLSFSSLRTPGLYRIRVGDSASSPFRVGSGPTLYGRLVSGAAAFLQEQRDGAEVIAGALHRRPSHLNDARAAVYAVPRYRNGMLSGSLHPTGLTVDLTGGWFDSGDYLKFSGTASFTDVLLLFTLREYGSALPGRSALAAEARFGTDWLLKTWDQRRRVLYEQVGLGDGNGDSLLGDHDLWRLPQRDDRLRDPALRYLAHRPVFAANRPGASVSPNLAGREAAAFALCSQVFRSSDPVYADRCLLAGQTLYDAAAKRWTGALAGSVPAGYYPEQEWRDDLELAATELFLASRTGPATGLPHQANYYLKPASSWADAYMGAATAGTDALNLYDVAGLAHYDLYRVMVATGHTTDLWTNASDVLGDLHDQLSLAAHLSETGPFGLADPATPDDTVAHALGYAAEARLYDALTGKARFEAFAQHQLGWVLGANPWGSSFVVGAGSGFPRCLAHQVANLSGSLNGGSPILAGAVVDGPTSVSGIVGLGAPDGFRPCSDRARTYSYFDGRGFAYRDDVRSFATSEPSDDLAALSLLAFAQEVKGGPPRPVRTLPG